MSAGTIETTFAGGAGGDEPYIAQGIQDAEDHLKQELGYRPGDFVIEPVAFSLGALGITQRGRRQGIGIHTGGFVLHKRHLVGYTPERASQISSLN
jgi:hypothetical protein